MTTAGKEKLGRTPEGGARTDDSEIQAIMHFLLLLSDGHWRKVADLAAEQLTPEVLRRWIGEAQHLGAAIECEGDFFRLVNWPEIEGQVRAWDAAPDREGRMEPEQLGPVFDNLDQAWERCIDPEAMLYSLEALRGRVDEMIHELREEAPEDFK